MDVMQEIGQALDGFFEAHGYVPSTIRVGAARWDRMRSSCKTMSEEESRHSESIDVEVVTSPPELLELVAQYAKPE